MERVSRRSLCWLGLGLRGEEVLKSLLSFERVENPRLGGRRHFIWTGCSEGNEELSNAGIRESRVMACSDVDAVDSEVGRIPTWA